MEVMGGENEECLLEGLKGMFDYMGRVGRVIGFDNVWGGVKRMLGKGERELRERFEGLVLHYGFECEF